jgi:hypothetical protein
LAPQGFRVSYENCGATGFVPDPGVPPVRGVTGKQGLSHPR